MAIETNGFKDYLGALPQQSNVDSIMAKDANGNPVWIKKADLAQVAAELIGTATTGKDGLLGKDVFISRLQYLSLSQDRIVKLSNKLNNFDGITLIGVDITAAAPCHVVITSVVGSICYGGDKPVKLALKIDGNKNIYASVPIGGDIRFLVIGCNSAISNVNSFPSDAVDLPKIE